MQIYARVREENRPLRLEDDLALEVHEGVCTRFSTSKGNLDVLGR